MWGKKRENESLGISRRKSELERLRVKPMIQGDATFTQLSYSLSSHRVIADIVLLFHSTISSILALQVIKLLLKLYYVVETRPDTRLPKSCAGGQGPYLRSPDHFGRGSEFKEIK